jgi:heme exporter protein D
MKGKAAKGTPGDQIFTKVSVLVFLGVFLMGLGAELPLWTAVYRAFFVWLAVSLAGGALRVGWKYHLYRQREQDLHANLSRAREQEERLLQERRQKRGQTLELLGTAGERAAAGDGAAAE